MSSLNRTVGYMVSRVSFALTNSSTVPSDLRGEIVHALHLAQVDVAGTNPLPSFKTESTLSLVRGTALYDLPDDFDKIVDPSVYLDTSPKRTLEYYEEQDYVDREGPRFFRTDGQPEAYTLRWRDSGTGRWQIKFIPTPDASYTVRYTYFALPCDLSNASDDTYLDPRFPVEAEKALLYSAILNFPQMLGTDQEVIISNKYREALRTLGAGKKPIVGNVQQNRRYRSKISPYGQSNITYPSSVTGTEYQ